LKFSLKVLNVFWWFLTHVVVSGRYAERPLKRHLGSGVSQEDLCVISAISFFDFGTYWQASPFSPFSKQRARKARRERERDTHTHTHKKRVMDRVFIEVSKLLKFFGSMFAVTLCMYVL
jgi:hypothetical protein